MRYGIFSDVHSNIAALDSVLQAYASEQIDMFFCVGDIVGYGAEPEECLARLRGLPVIAIAGNHDRAVAGRIKTAAFTPDAREAVSWTADRLDLDSLEFLGGLRLVYSDTPLTLVHGTLNDPADFYYLSDASSAADTFALLQTQLCFVGHTHVAGVYSRDGDGRIAAEHAGSLTLREGARYIVNVGSVGQPRDHDPRAAYCVFDTVQNKVEIKRVAYDVESARRAIREAGLPGFLGDRLLEGR